MLPSSALFAVASFPFHSIWFNFRIASHFENRILINLFLLNFYYWFLFFGCCSNTIGWFAKYMTVALNKIIFVCKHLPNFSRRLTNLKSDQQLNTVIENESLNHSLGNKNTNRIVSTCLIAHGSQGKNSHCRAGF